MSEISLTIGQSLTVTAMTSVGDDRWTANCESVPSSWTCTLRHRGNLQISAGMQVSTWVLQLLHLRREIVVTDSDFGFLPISDRKRPNYVKSLRHFASLLEETTSVDSADVDSIAEVKGMFTRSWKQDQWDWCAVYTALNAPGFDQAREMSILLGSLGACIRSKRLSLARDLLQRLRDSDLGERVNRALASISLAGPRLAKRSRFRDQRPSRMTIDPDTTIQTRYDKAKLDEANRTHAELLALLRTHLQQFGYTIEANDLIDAYTRLRTGPAIFEAKSITIENEVSQIRQGLSQLYEYRFRHRLNNASLWLILSRAPSAKFEWMTDYIEKDRDVRLIWSQNGRLAGPSLARLIESGSSALRRFKDDQSKHV